LTAQRSGDPALRHCFGRAVSTGRVVIGRDLGNQWIAYLSYI